MVRKILAVVLGATLSLSIAAAAPEQKDDPKCKDHELFTRMPGSWIHNCDHKTFDAYEFPVAKGKTERVEGELWKLNYYPQAAQNPKPSELQILRNFENAVQKAGGKSVYAEKARETFTIARDGKEYWVALWAEFTGKYGFVIVRREAMKQDIQANAEVFKNDIRATGHAAVYGITFETDSAVIRPESAQALGEVAKLLKADPTLKVFVVGHTDNTGTIEHNLKLSNDRAQSVMQALIGEYGIAPARLRSFGCGPFAPVAPNTTEDGKAKNRRVELVQQ